MHEHVFIPSYESPVRCNSLPDTKSRGFYDSWHQSILLLPASRWHSEVPPYALLFGLDETMSHGHWNGPWGEKEKAQKGKKMKESRHGGETGRVRKGEKREQKNQRVKMEGETEQRRKEKR